MYFPYVCLNTSSLHAYHIWLNDTKLDTSEAQIPVLESGQTAYRQTSFYCASQIIVFFYKLKVCGKPAPSKSTDAIFPTAFAHFVSLGHILLILAIFQTFKLLYLLRCALISDLWHHYCKKIMTCWRFRWWLTFFLAKKYFKIELSIFLDIMLLLHALFVQEFMWLALSRYLLYWTHNISEVCL